MNCTIRVCPEKDIVCSTPDECATRQTGCKMLIKLVFSPPAAPDRCPHGRGLQTDPEPCYAEGCYTPPAAPEGSEK